MMKGIVYLGDSEVEVRDFRKPEPGPGQVVVQMKAAGLCGSDLHKYHNSRAWAEERRGMISGHEPSGVVAEIGPGVTHLSVGDRVCVYHSLGCGHCQTCLSGEPVFCADEGAFGRTCDGSHADFMATDARYCLPLPDAFSFAVGTQLACTAGTAFAAVKKVLPHPGDALVVFGLGPVGMSALLMAGAMGYRTIGVDVNPHRIALAKRLGNDDVVDIRKDDPVQAIMDITRGNGAAGVVECSGNGTARTQAAAVAARRGTVVYVGAGAKEISLAPTHVMLKELTIRGNAVYSRGAYFEAVAFLQTHYVPLDELVTHRFGIDQAVEAFALFDRGDTGKVIFEWP